MENWLLQQAVVYFPTLRYIAFAFREELTSDWREDYAGNRTPWRWWKIQRDKEGSPEEIQEIPAWEGERVRTYLRNADADAMENFDGEFF